MLILFGGAIVIAYILGYRMAPALAFLYNIPKEVLSEVKTALKEVEVVKTPRKNLDFIHVFCTSKSSLKKELAGWKKSLSKNGLLWISWPKKTSKLETDLTSDVVRDIGLNSGLVDIKVCAVNDIWSGLKFVYRKEDR